VIGKGGGSVKPDEMKALQRILSQVILLLALGQSASSQTSNSLPTLYLIGDSTVNTPTKGQQGWGTPLPGFFDQSKITVINRARGGRSSRTFFTEGLWEQVRDSLKPGDFVLMQFGHNDGGPLGDGRARASLKGNGDETQDVEIKSTGKKETVHSYGWYLRKYIGDAKAKGATPIVLSPIPRNIWKDGKVARAANDYGKWAAEAAKGEGVPFVNLNEIIAKHYEDAGQPKVAKTYFTATDHTHTTPEGAKLNAACVCEGIRSLKDCALANYLVPIEKHAKK
jgi:lysophospholipase L1-like esterase